MSEGQELAGPMPRLAREIKAVIGHRLNNPLCVVVANLHMLKDAGLTGEFKAALEDALGAADTLSVEIATLTHTKREP